MLLLIVEAICAVVLAGTLAAGPMLVMFLLQPMPRMKR